MYILRNVEVVLDLISNFLFFVQFGQLRSPERLPFRLLDVFNRSQHLSDFDEKCDRL